jgi:hypothetical protein
MVFLWTGAYLPQIVAAVQVLGASRAAKIVYGNKANLNSVVRCRAVSANRKRGLAQSPGAREHRISLQGEIATANIVVCLQVLDVPV